MPGLREKVISIICEEWQKGQDREIELNAATISERLQQDGVAEASEDAVRLELTHLVDQRLIATGAEPPGTDDRPVRHVSPELCL